MAALNLAILLLVVVITEGRSAPNAQGIGMEEQQPMDGYLLGMKVTYNGPVHQGITGNYIVLFNISLEGDAVQLWDMNTNDHHYMFEVSSYAIDVQKELVYIGIIDQYLSVDLRTGRVVNKFPKAVQNYLTYNYDSKNDVFYGICSSTFMSWCETKPLLNKKNVSINVLYTLPHMAGGPILDIYDTNIANQVIWYMPYDQSVVGFNITTRKQVFQSGPTAAFCIKYDKRLNKTFTISYQNDVMYLAELQPKPSSEKLLLKLPSGIQLNGYGLCDYDQSTHTLFAVVEHTPGADPSRPTDILIIDSVALKYSRVPFKFTFAPYTRLTGLTYVKN